MTYTEWRKELDEWNKEKAAFEAFVNRQREAFMERREQLFAHKPDHDDPKDSA